MRSKILILIVAIALGLLAAFVALRYINGARAEVEAEDRPVDVLVAQQDLPAGMTAEELAGEKYVVLVSVPRRYVADGAISSTAAITGKVLTAPLSRGEQVTNSRFSLPAAAGLSFAVPEDYVAIAMPNTAPRGVAGLLRPGDSVAVYATFEPEGGLEEAVTKLVLRKARVLAVGSSTTPGAQESSDEEQQTTARLGGSPASNQEDEVPNTVTLALSPSDAEKLVFANEQGKVWLALIGSGTTEVPATGGEQFPDIIE
jgi:pilus assembly protein CpaB